MKFIDRKGKLFGVINVFDLFVLLMLALSIFFIYKWIQMAEDPSWVNVKLSHTRCIVVAGLPPYIVDLMKEGDEAYDDDGLVVARVEKVLIDKVQQRAPVALYKSKEGGKLFFIPDRRSALVNITVQLDLLSYERKGDIYAVVSGSGTPIRIGLNLGIRTKKYSIPFIVRKILDTRD